MEIGAYLLIIIVEKVIREILYAQFHMKNTCGEALRVYLHAGVIDFADSAMMATLKGLAQAKII